MIQEITTQFTTTIFEPTEDEKRVALLLNALERRNLEEFKEILQSIDIDQVYDNPLFPEPQLFSRFLVLYCLGAIQLHHTGTENLEDFLRVVLEQKPNLSIEFGPEYPLLDYCKDLYEDLKYVLGELSETKDAALIQRYKELCGLLEMIFAYMHEG